MFKKIINLSLASAMSIAIIGCADTSTRPEVYKSSQLQQGYYTSYATILSLKEIEIEKDEGLSNALLTVAGTAVGAIAGSHIGGGSGAIVGAIGGGLAGGYATNEAVGKLQKTKGVEFTVKTQKDQRILTFAQHGNISNYFIGQKVKLVTDNLGRTRIDSN